MNPVSIHDVAAKVGVSASTVSRAFSRPDLVSEKTRAKVLEAADAMNFSISRASLTLKSGQTFRIALLLSATVTNWFNSHIFEGLDSMFHPAGYDVCIYPIGGVQARRDFFETLPARRNADAVIVPSFDIDSEEASRLETMNVPIAGINTSSREGMAIWSSIDEQQGAQLTVRHLTSLGHRSIAYVCRDPSIMLSFSTHQRLTDIREACREAGVEFSIITVSDDDRNLDAAFDKLVTLPEIPSAICCQEDAIAIPMMCKLRNFGLRIPQDVSITGFDDGTYAKEMGLTTIRQDPYAMSVDVAGKLLKLINGREVEEPFRTYAPKLIVRSSTAPSARKRA